MSQQKKGTKTGGISAKELAEIISYDVNNSNNSYGDLDEHIQHIKAETEARGFAKDIFVEALKESVFVKEAGCEIPYKYKITVSNLNIYFSKSEKSNIFMHNLSINENCPMDYKSNRRKFSHGLYFEFKHNYIYSDDSPGYSMNVFLGHNATLSFIDNRFKGAHIVVRVDKTAGGVLANKTALAVLEFKKNISENLISISKYNSEGKSSVAGTWRLKKGIRGQIYAANEIENSINKFDFEENNKLLNDLKEDSNPPKKFKRGIFKADLYQNNKIKVTPEQVEGEDDKCIIRISDNEFNVLNIFGETNFYFEGRNVIKQLIPYAPGPPEVVPSKISIESSIHWGAYQELDENECYILFICKKILIKLKFFILQRKLFIYLKKKLSTSKPFLLHNKLVAVLKKLYSKLMSPLTYEESLGVENFLAHKKIFSTLKQRAIANKDVMQEIILQREISKCDHGIAKSEKGWGAWQDTMIFEFSKCISNYGTSWIRPLSWLIAFNVLIVVLVCITTKLCANSSVGAIFFELFNPTSYLPKLLEPKNLTPDPSTWISFLFIFQKVVLAFTLYEMIKIFRRFGRR